MSTDLAEFVGAAVGLNLLFHVPMFAAGLVTAVVAFAILALEQRGYRRFELAIAALLGIVLLGFAYDLVAVRGAPAGIAAGLVPSFAGPDSLLLVAGIIGATVMPHVVYLHSALTKSRVHCRDDAERRELLRFQRLDVLVALGTAGLINLSMLVIAASLFNRTRTAGRQLDRGCARRARSTGRRRRGACVRGRAARVRVVLIERGHLCRAGGHAGLHRPPHPACSSAAGSQCSQRSSCSGSGCPPPQSLVISQVVLSFGIPFALVPLVLLTRRADIMGALVNRTVTTAAAGCIASVIMLLNVWLLYATLRG